MEIAILRQSLTFTLITENEIRLNKNKTMKNYFSIISDLA